MNEELILRLPVAELRRAAARGTGYYSCERFEDTYGRLVVGVGARLEGRILSHVAGCGRKDLYVSPRAMCDDARFRSALQRAMQRESTQAGGTGNEGTGHYPEVWDKASARVRKAADGVLQAVSRICPDVAKLMGSQHPDLHDLAHGAQVATYARRLTDAFSRARDCGRIPAGYTYSGRMRETVFLAGMVHDIGRWNGRPVEGHEARGAEMLEALAGRSARLHSLSEIVAYHHRPLSRLRGRAWKRHKAAPVALAEAVVEFPGPPGKAVHQLVLEGVTGAAGPILASLCNLEGTAPPRAVVRMRGRAAGNRTDSPFDLAISLRAQEDDPFKPYLLRFARQDEGGRLVPLLRPEGGDREAAGCLSWSGHPGSKDERLEVVALLSEDSYEQTFGQYERLVPALQAVLDRRFRSQNATPVP